MAAYSFPVLTAQKRFFNEPLTAKEREELPLPLEPEEFNAQPVRPSRNRASRRQQELQEFDPLHENYVANAPVIKPPDWFVNADYNYAYEEGGRQIIRWRFF